VRAYAKELFEFRFDAFSVEYGGWALPRAALAALVYPWALIFVAVGDRRRKSCK
jgi:hypothetical protein